MSFVPPFILLYLSPFSKASALICPAKEWIIKLFKSCRCRTAVWYSWHHWQPLKISPFLLSHHTETSQRKNESELGVISWKHHSSCLARNPFGHCLYMPKKQEAKCKLLGITKAEEQWAPRSTGGFLRRILPLEGRSAYKSAEGSVPHEQ